MDARRVSAVVLVAFECTVLPVAFDWIVLLVVERGKRKFSCEGYGPGDGLEIVSSSSWT